jgi:gentisate 1,2-dioxygenase
MPDDLAPSGFYDGLTARSLMVGWARREQPAGSKSEMQVHVWRAAEARAALREASRFVGTDVAERRNLIMVNPAPLRDNRMKTVTPPGTPAPPRRTALDHLRT